MTLQDLETANAEQFPKDDEYDVQTDDEHSTHRTFLSGLWKARFKKEKLEAMQMLDPVGRKLIVSMSLRVNAKKLKEEGRISVPDGSFDKAREAIADAVSEW